MNYIIILLLLSPESVPKICGVTYSKFQIVSLAFSSAIPWMLVWF